MHSVKFLAVLFAFTLLLLHAPGADAQIPGNGVEATQYEVSVSRVELCPDSGCNGAVIIGSGTKTFDIASAAVGADVGNYASISGLSPGETYSHIRVTIGTSFTIAGGGLDDGGQNCQTVTANAAGGHAGVGTGTVGGAGTAMVLTIPNVGVGGITLADYAAFNLTKDDNSATGTITFPLTSTYTVAAAEPLITVTFDTATGLGVLDAGGGNCSVFPRPPGVTITVQ